MSDSYEAELRRSRTPDDAEMDQLLRRFFVHEVPQRLSEPLRLNGVVRSSVSRVAASDVSVTQDVTEGRTRLTIPIRSAPMTQPAPPASRWIAVSISIIAISACLLLASQLGPLRPHSGSSGRDAVTGLGGPASGTGDSLPEDGAENETGADATMLVSPGSHQPGAGSVEVGEDGVTLEETEGVELNPRPRRNP